MAESGTREAAASEAEVPPSLENAVRATVEIMATDGTSAGVLVDARGLIVTARHTLDVGEASRRQITVRVLPDTADEKQLPAFAFWSHRRLDCALLWVRGATALPAVPLGVPAELHHGDVVYAVGSPAGHTGTVSRGIVSKPSHRERGVEWIQTDAATGPGNSGGPLIDEGGRVLGINLWGIEQFDALHFALPIDYVTPFIGLARERGPAACKADAYCVLCGFWDRERPTWYCRNCGVRSPSPDLWAEAR